MGVCRLEITKLRGNSWRGARMGPVYVGFGRSPEGWASRFRIVYLYRAMLQQECVTNTLYVQFELSLNGHFVSPEFSCSGATCHCDNFVSPGLLRPWGGLSSNKMLRV
jgi:hypothetical protein